MTGRSGKLLHYITLWCSGVPEEQSKGLHLGSGDNNSMLSCHIMPYLSGTLGNMPTRSVFRGRCHCCLICAH